MTQCTIYFISTSHPCQIDRWASLVDHPTPMAGRLFPKIVGDYDNGKVTSYCKYYEPWFKGVLHLLPKISMFCALSQNNQKLFEK